MMPDNSSSTALSVAPVEAAQPDPIRDYGIVNMEWRKDYLRWFINELIEASLGAQLARQQGKTYTGAKTIGEIVQQPGPHGMLPDYRTVRRWLKEEWAREIAQEIGDQVEVVMNLEVEMRWPRIMRHQMDIAETAPGRDSTLAATFVANQRKNRGVDTGSAIGKRIEEILGSGRFDGTISVTERTRQLLIETAPAPADPLLATKPAV